MAEAAAEYDPVDSVLMFEGEAVTSIEGKLPAVSLSMEQGFARNTVLRLALEIRVKEVRMSEDKDGHLVRTHVFVLEDAELVASFQAADRRDDVLGSASTAVIPDATETEALGVQFGRTSDRWPIVQDQGNDIFDV